MFTRFTDESNDVVAGSLRAATNFGQPRAATIHILYALLEQRQGCSARACAAVDITQESVLGYFSSAQQPAEPAVRFTSEAMDVFNRAIRGANKREVTPQHIMLALLHMGDVQTIAILKAAGVTRNRLVQQIYTFGGGGITNHPPARDTTNLAPVA